MSFFNSREGRSILIQGKKVYKKRYKWTRTLVSFFSRDGKGKLTSWFRTASNNLVRDSVNRGKFVFGVAGFLK